jgi:hypothetical protein
MAAVSKTPTGLGAGGRDLWKSVTDVNQLDAPQKVTLLEACRAKDRLDKLDELLRCDVDTWATLHLDPHSSDGNIFELRITQALMQANSTANLLKQLLAALRLPDASTGRRPQARGGARGTYAPTGKASSTVSSIERARARKSG